ncbi:MAG: cell division protein FtsA [Bacteroidales bacterium]|nr:cell division protein FtsA [Bacteroidales bacterium]
MAKNNQTQDRSPKMIVALDIGTTKILMAMGYMREDGKIEVCGYGSSVSTGVRYGFVFNPRDTINNIKTALEQLMNTVSEPVKEVYVGVAGRHIRSVASTNSITRPAGLDRMVEDEEIENMQRQMEGMTMRNSEIIAVIPQYYEVDGTITNRASGTLCQKLVGHYQLVTGDTDEVKRIVLSVNGAELVTKKLILEPIASGMVCLSDQEKKNGVALIDIGGGTTDLVIFYEGVPVYVKVIPVGGKAITEDISKLNLTFEQAEELKIRHGNCVPNPNSNNFITIPDYTGFGQGMKINETNLSQVINARVGEDILKPVQEAIAESGYANVVNNIVITGGGSQLKNIHSLAEFIIHRPCRIGYPIFGISSTIDSALKSPVSSTALGLLQLGCMAEKGSFVESAPVEEPNEPVKEPKKSGVKLPDVGRFFDSVTDWFGKFITNTGEGIN